MSGPVEREVDGPSQARRLSSPRPHLSFRVDVNVRALGPSQGTHFNGLVSTIGLHSFHRCEAGLDVVRQRGEARSVAVQGGEQPGGTEHVSGGPFDVIHPKKREEFMESLPLLSPPELSYRGSSEDKTDIYIC